MKTKQAQKQTAMSSYNLRPRKNTVDYRVLNGYKFKANTQPEECPPQPDIEANLPLNEQKNMKMSFTEKFDNAVLQLNLLLGQITNEKNKDKQITLILHFLKILYHFIVEYRNFNAHTFSTCKTLTETYLMNYKEFNPEIIQHCIENKKYKELETFHIHSSNLQSMV